MGSEMCIRDRRTATATRCLHVVVGGALVAQRVATSDGVTGVVQVAGRARRARARGHAVVGRARVALRVGHARPRDDVSGGVRVTSPARHALVIARVDSEPRVALALNGHGVPRRVRRTVTRSC